MGSSLIPGLLVPIVFILVGAVGKKIVRATPFQRSDFFMGVELTLASMSAQLLYLIETSQQAINNSSVLSAESFLMTGGLLVITLLVLMILFAVHQSNINSSALKQYLALTLFSNSMGIVLMLTFVVFVKN